MNGLKIKYVVDMVTYEHISGQLDKDVAKLEIKKKLPKNATEFKIISFVEIKVKPKGKPQPKNDPTVNFLKKMFGI